jgi:threonine/homoserine/homoserine lactone efflux protein
MHFLDAALKGILLGLFMSISVGPTLFAVLKYSLNHSYKAGIAFVLGVSFSDMLYVTVANVAASWLEALSEYERIIAYAGAGVLIVVGLAGLFGKYTPKKPSSTKPTITGGHYFRIWTSGFLINTINPGVIITWLAAVTATANTSTIYRIILFGTCLGLILIVDFSKVFLADAIRRRLTLRRILYLHRFAAACILFIGIALLVSTAFNIQFKKHDENQSAHQHIQSERFENLHQSLVSLQPHV